MFCYRARKYIGAYLAAMGGADAVVVRGRHRRELGRGARADLRRARVDGRSSSTPRGTTAIVGGREGSISVEGVALAAWVIPTDEELLIARDTVRCVRGVKQRVLRISEMNFSIIIIAACVLFALTDVAPASCGSNRRREPPRNLNPTAMATPASNEGKEMKVLAQGQYGKVAEPFLVVAREAKVYGELRALVAGLPDLGTDFFEQNAVVAAFAGTRRSGGASASR